MCLISVSTLKTGRDQRASHGNHLQKQNKTKTQADKISPVHQNTVGSLGFIGTSGFCRILRATGRNLKEERERESDDAKRRHGFGYRQV